jgi:hypothetical protein
MYPLYLDLREKLGEPLWHDQHGVPRYAPFEPDLLGIYDRWACLFVVKCQACERAFDCAVGWDFLSYAATSRATDDELQEMVNRQHDPHYVLPKFVSWGDAPWHDMDNQCAGTTMTTDIIRIKEVWHKVRTESQLAEWQRVEISDGLEMVLCDIGQD